MSSDMLSIYIPTYNRAAPLTDLLVQLAEMRAHVPSGQLEIVVADNASTDQTYDLMQVALREQIVDLYVRRAKNMRADTNMLDCFRLTRGSFVWILCDDDLPMPSAFKNIRQVMQEHGNSISMIYLNRSWEGMHGEVFRSPVSVCATGVERSVTSILSSPGVDLLTASTLVLKRPVCHGQYASQFGLGRFISPLTLALDALCRGPAYLFSEPQVRYRDGDKSEWGSEWPNIWKENVPALLRQFVTDNHIEPSVIQWEMFNRA
ncbi:MAG: glycosyltransferase family 2 protein [Pseudomonadota bacterium]|jgi:glycosyltransferase involved in cell wall biosynthesis